MHPISFTIDASDIKSPARKPRHLESRLKARNSTKQTNEGRARHEAFLAARKNKLSLRTAHVQNVVNVHRERESNLKKEKLERLASTQELASKKRQDRIDSLVSNNAQAVQRAKEVSRAQLQRRVESSAELQKSIEMNLRISASRRQRLRSIPRAKILDPQSWALQESLAVQDESASLIQNWWRKVKLIPVARLYKKLGLTRAKANSMPFTKLMNKLQSASLIKATGFVLIRAKKLSDTPITHWKTPARVILSAYMFTAHPSEICKTMDAQEKDLMDLAETLLADLEHWLAAVKSTVVGLLGKVFLNTFIKYYAAFDAWKTRDTVDIVNQLIMHFIDLDKLWISVCHQHDAQYEWAPAIQDEQSNHLKRIQGFGQDAINRLLKVRSEFRKVALDGGKVKVNDVVPQTAVAPLYYHPVIEEHKDSVSKSVQEDGMEIDEVGEDQPTDSDMNAFGHILSNEMLAHELILDPNFSLKPTEKTPFAKQVEDIAKRAMVDTIKEQMKAGTYSSHLIAALSDIQKGLLGMVNEKGPIAHEIHQVFDFDYIKQQMDSKVFNLVKLVQYTGEKMLQLCAPIRDKSIREIGNEKDVVVAMFKLLDLIQEMKLDLANYRLQAIKPILTQQAVDYEKNKFNLAIFNGSLKLTKTKKWLEDTVKQMNAVKESRNPEMIQTQSKIKYSDVFNHALLGLLFSTKPIDPSLLPETLSIDAKRLFDFQNELQAMTIVSAITMLSKNIVVELRLEHQVMQELTKRLFAHLRSENTTLEVLVKEITDTCNILFHKQTKVVSNVSNLTSNPMQQRLKELSPEQIELITNMVSKTVSYKDPFFSVLNRRLEKLTRLALESTFRRNSLAKHGLDLIGGELESLMVKITLMAKHNKNVFGEHYDKILKSIV